MREEALLRSRRSSAAAEPSASHAPAALAAAELAPRRLADCFAPRLEISPLTIRPAACFEADRELARRSLC